MFLWFEGYTLVVAGTKPHIVCISSFCLLFCQEFAKAVEPENVKQDIIPLFHTLASDEQVREEKRRKGGGGGKGRSLGGNLRMGGRGG